MARRHQCASCGRDVRDIPDSVRRFEAGSWYCSQSCFLAYESSASRSSIRARTPKRRSWRRKLGLTLGGILGVLVILAVIGALVGGPSTSTTASTRKLHRTRPNHPRLGTPLRPVPQGRTALVYDRKWSMKVDVFRRNANDFVSHHPAPGAQLVLVTLTMKYLGGGSAGSETLNLDLHLIGKHEASYSANDGCYPPRMVNRQQAVFSQQSISGNACFEVAKNDLSSLRLYVGQTRDGKPTVGSTWFALHK